MANEAEKRRERRRQKILENAESRMSRIMFKEVNPTDKPAQSISNGDIVGNAERASSPLGSAPIVDYICDGSDDPPMPFLRSPSSQLQPNPSAFNDVSSTVANDATAQPNDEMAKQLQMLLTQVMQNPDGNAFEILTQLAAASSDENQASSPFLSQMNRTPVKPKHLILREPNNRSRTIVILFLALSARIFLPYVPEEYAVMFGPLYLLELLSFSLCILLSSPPNLSSMNMVYSLMSMFGVRQPLIRVSQTLTGSLELLVKDIRTYMLGFFMTHVVCEHIGISIAAES